MGKTAIRFLDDEIFLSQTDALRGVFLEPAALPSDSTSTVLPSDNTSTVLTKEVKKIFVSHSSNDDVFVSKFCNTLFSLGGMVTWVDHKDIGIGRDWEEEIKTNLDGTHFMIVVLTPASVASHNVRVEWSYFLENKKPIYPVLLKPCIIPLRLKFHQYFPFGDNFDTSMSELIEILRKDVSR